jgi:hypothetical protein
MFRILPPFSKLSSVASLVTPSDSQFKGPGHGNSPDEITKFNLEVQSQRKDLSWEMLSPFRSRRLIRRKHLSRLN